MSVSGFVRSDRMSTGLLAAALFSCLVALAAAASPALAPIPERLLERVQGANPNYYQSPTTGAPNCSALEAVYITDQGTTAVAGNACIALNTVCVTCDTQTNYSLYSLSYGSPDVFPKPSLAVSCDRTGRNTWGTCQLVGGNLACTNDNDYTCGGSVASVWPYEP